MLSEMISHRANSTFCWVLQHRMLTVPSVVPSTDRSGMVPVWLSLSFCPDSRRQLCPSNALWNHNHSEDHNWKNKYFSLDTVNIMCLENLVTSEMAKKSNCWGFTFSHWICIRIVFKSSQLPTVINWSRSKRNCSCWKPRACSVSWMAIPDSLPHMKDK